MHWGGRQREIPEGGDLPPGAEIRRATEKDREAILEVVETCFAPPGGHRPGRIEERFWHVYAPDQFQPSAWQVAVAGGANRRRGGLSRDGAECRSLFPPVCRGDGSLHPPRVAGPRPDERPVEGGNR